jgi:hypothetical protein
MYNRPVPGEISSILMRHSVSAGLHVVSISFMVIIYVCPICMGSGRGLMVMKYIMTHIMKIMRSIVCGVFFSYTF